MDLGHYIDHTLLKANASKSDIERLCAEAVFYSLYSVCVNPCWVKYSSEIVSSKNVLVTTVAGFPIGANRVEVKARECEAAILDGADEIDMVINIGRLKSGDYEYVLNEITELRKVCRGKILKVIVETCLLTEEEKKIAVKLVIDGGGDFIKTSTGFSTGGATTADVALFKREAKGLIKIKASGGIRDLKTMTGMIEAGADRIGVSASVSILGEADVHS